MAHHDLVKGALQASSSAAELVVLLWTVLDPCTRSLLFTAEMDWGAQRHVCLINLLFCEYTENSKDAKSRVMENLSRDGGTYLATRRFLVTAMARAERMKEACEAPKGNPLIVLRNYQQLVEMVSEFIISGESVVNRSALADTPFIYRFMSGISSIAEKLRTPGDSHLYGLAIAIVKSNILEWTNIPGIHPVNGALQLVRGGVLPFLANALIHGPDVKSAPDSRVHAYITGCMSIASWLAFQGIFPAVLKEMNDSLSSIDLAKPRCARLQRPVGQVLDPEIDSVHWTTTTWNVTLKAFRSKEKVWHAFSAKLRNPQPVFCDNPKVCRWKKTWIKAPTRLFHVSVVANTYREKLPEIHALHEKDYPHVPLNDLIISFNILNGPASLDVAPSLFALDVYCDPNGTRMKALDGIGRKRFEDTISEFRREPDLRIVEGIFKFQDSFLWVLTRIRVDAEQEVGDQDPADFSGFSYLGLDFESKLWYTSWS
ncbi:hypothetical protein MD484_g8569, partial [Candolleomyces efflorescens]